METTDIHSKSSTLTFENVRKFSKKTDEYFDIDHLVSREPYSQFKKWFDDVENQQIDEARIFTLATTTKSGIPSCRPLRLASIIDGEGFTFFTNYDSRKGEELEENPYAAMSFWWPSTARAIRIEGQVTKLSSAKSDDYFYSLPREMQVGTVVNVQCKRIIQNRQQLLDLKNKYSGQSQLQRPDRWGGYLLVPHTLEFFQRQHDWVSDRIRFRRLLKNDNVSSLVIDGSTTHQGDDDWVFERLAP
ncbi:unnamed protein product [Rotaria sordida]|uniref:pyridoxal 5'-phosphate synthase n=1 Tax=Rotaria sordida TaxID=392033 RepID=A0A815KZB2_9BILA|nr:unnamed protein product [Rotaria sordida]CAF1402347.1 unnamed protein product [Rotaria sordida]CAF1429227.1 unnamed protein product [Rotaria sordida]